MSVVVSQTICYDLGHHKSLTFLQKDQDYYLVRCAIFYKQVFSSCAKHSLILHLLYQINILIYD